MAGSREELKASVEIDWTKAEQRLREIDQKQKGEDARAEILERRARKLEEQFRAVEQRSVNLEAKVGNRLEDMLKDFGKFSAKALVFDTLTQFSDVVPETARGIAGIATTGLSVAATSGNPLLGAVAAMAKSIDVLRDSQKAYQQEIESIRKDIARREEETRRVLERISEQRTREQAAQEREFARIRFEMDREERELMHKTYALTEGVR